MGMSTSTDNSNFNSLVYALVNEDNVQFDAILQKYGSDQTPIYINNGYTIHHLLVLKSLILADDQLHLFCDSIIKYKNILPVINTPIQKYNFILFYLDEYKVEFKICDDVKDDRIITCNVLGCTPSDIAQLIHEIYVEKRNIIEYILKIFENLSCKNVSNTKITVVTEEKKIMTCNICYTYEMNILFEPCNHVIACNNCSDKIIICPVCRKKINNKKKIIIS